MGGSVVFDKKSKRYLISIYWEGKRYRVFRHPVTGEPFWHEKSADKQLNKIRTEIDEGYFNPASWFPDSPLSVKEYSKAWLESADVTKKTLRDYTGYCKNHIVPFFRDKDIRTIRYGDIVKFKKYVSKKVAAKTTYNILAAFKTMMRFAWKSEDIPKLVPFPELSMSLPDEIEYLSMEQQDKVLSQIPEKDRPIFAFMMDNGTRIGEARALMKDHVKKNYINIKMIFSDNDLKLCSENKKGGMIGLTKYTHEVLKSIPENFSEFVFTRDDGKPYTNKNLNAIWQTACKKIKLKIKLYNAVRHSLGCQLLDMGIEMDVVRQQLRHTNIKMTQRYAQRSNNLVTDVLDRRRAQIIPMPKKGTK
ncbi:MAG: tyrosine-type recombinase/integrase [Desulfobacula sp.]|uniref:tyrosine-type recombinase/integrase n=1 Tax=Desulfobacula sp. TaxID=2593537 RepID=UPI0039B8B9E2|nr:tyrosine-type recombinase/integrase [Desulfobacula sp.]